MKALDKKLLMDIWRMKGQALAIALVIISGVATYVMLTSAMTSLRVTRERFYREFRFADAFVQLKRAPESLRERIGDIPGVDHVETRVVASVKLEVDGYNEPVTGRLVSIPDTREPHLNRLYIRKGRPVEPWRDDEALISEAFAEAHGLEPGDGISAVINGRWKRLKIVGTALSPEYVLQVRPGAISPDFKRYAILWMGRDALGAAYDMEGAFNDVALTLAPGAALDDVLARLDILLDRYGGVGSYGRKDQISHRFLSEEFKQLERSAEIFPAIFIAVAAFLLNVVLSRTISTQREQIAALKAFGYGNAAVGIHYVKMVSIMALAGIAGGLAVGAWLGNRLGGIYMVFYRFPYLIYDLEPTVALTAALITLVSCLVGTVFSVRRASVLPPAEALRPEPPGEYRMTLLDRLGLGRMLSQPTRMIIRNIERRPVKALLSVTGIALSCAIMIAGTFSRDAVDFMINVQFMLSQKEDMTVTFTEPASRRSVYELKGIEGVERAEPFRSVPARLRFRQRSYRTSIQGMDPGNRLQSLLDTGLKPIDIPPSGVVLTDYLAGMLGVKEGDELTVEVLEGERPVRRVAVAGLAKQYLGVMGYMDIDALNALMREGHAVSGAYLAVDGLHARPIYRRLLEMPKVAGAVERKVEIRTFYETQAEILLFFTFVASLLAATIAFGVIYNSARIALSERTRELASLRVLGYTRGEISYIFLGELGALTIAAIPLGFVLGRGLCAYISKAWSSDLFRIPVVISPATYSLAATVVAVSAVLSGLIVRHRLDHLDLVEVLKARE